MVLICFDCFGLGKQVGRSRCGGRSLSGSFADGRKFLLWRFVVEVEKQIGYFFMYPLVWCTTKRDRVQPNILCCRINKAFCTRVSMKIPPIKIKLPWPAPQHSGNYSIPL
jgi:hypothetical protein